MRITTLVCFSVFMIASSFIISSKEPVQKGINKTIEEGLKEVNSSFYYQKKPISPLIVERFYPGASGARPTTITIDIASATGSNEYYNTSIKGGTTVTFNHGRGQYGSISSFSYQYIGRLQNGIHVVEVFDSGGGSAVFKGLCFFSFKTGKSSDNQMNYDQLLMTIEKYYGLCDQCNTKFTIDKNEVLLDITPTLGDYDHDSTQQHKVIVF